MSRLTTGEGPPSPRSWTELLLPQVPGASHDMVEQALLWILKDWCREGIVWLENLPNLLISSQRRYVLPTPFDGVSVGFVVGAKDNEQRAWFPADGGAFASTIGSRGGMYFMCPQPGVIQLPTRVPDTLATMQFRASLIPQTINVPDWIREHHGNAIETGVVGRLMMMPLKPWTAVSDGRLRLQQYLNWRNVERVRAVQSYLPATQRWAFPRFGA